MTTEIQVNRIIPGMAFAALCDAIRVAIGADKLVGCKNMKGQFYLIFEPKATETDQNTAVQLATAFDITSRTPEETARAQRQTDLLEILDTKATNAISQIDSDLAILGGTPNNAQVVAILSRALTRQKVEIKALQRLKDFIG